MMSYNETLRDIEETYGFVPVFFKSIPQDVLVQEWPRMKKYGIEETEIPGKYRDLIRLAVSGAIKCPYCVYFFTVGAKGRGATEKEIAETAALAGMVSDWSTMLHTTSQDLDEVKRDVDRIAENMKAKMKVVQS